MLVLMGSKRGKCGRPIRRLSLLFVFASWSMLGCACAKDKSTSELPPAADEEVKTLRQDEDDAETPLCVTFSDLYANDQKLVSILCRNSNHPEQHPSGEHNIIDETGQHLEMKETYVELAGEKSAAQIVLTSIEPISCPEAIRVVGEVSVIDIGGTVGKSTYRRPWIKVHSFQCEPQR